MKRYKSAKSEFRQEVTDCSPLKKENKVGGALLNENESGN